MSPFNFIQIYSVVTIYVTTKQNHLQEICSEYKKS